MNKKLRIGLIMDSFEIPQWYYTIVEQLIESNYAIIELVVMRSNQHELSSSSQNNSAGKTSIYRSFMKFERNRFKVQPDALEITNAEQLLSGVDVANIQSESSEDSCALRSIDSTTIDKYKLDVLFQIGTPDAASPLHASARYGTWLYTFGIELADCDEHVGFWEVLQNQPITRSSLRVLEPNGDLGEILYQSCSQTHKRSITRTQNRCLWKSTLFLPRILKKLVVHGPSEGILNTQRIQEEQAHQGSRLVSGNLPDNLKMVRLLISYLARYFREKLMTFVYRERWIMLFGEFTEWAPDFSKFVRIEPPSDRFYADPFVVFENNEYFLFFEELPYDSNKGHISLIKMDRMGTLEGPTTIIDKAYHLSYPFIFRHAGEYLMIPESRADKTIQLYKCVEFPYRWEFQHNLMENIEAVDSTVYYYCGKWWLFTNMIEIPGASSFDELYLFFSDDIYSDNWTPHPLNPVISDVRSARPAGAIFVHDEKIIRPSQDCSKSYGYGLRFNEIQALNELEYAESEFAYIEPVWSKQIVANHTFNSANRMTVIDGMLRTIRRAQGVAD